MKLRNKKTGEVRNVGIFGDNFLIEAKDYPNDTTIVIKSLAELNAEWEDYEEPDELDEIISYITKGLEKEEIGVMCNDVLEKLEAWKRLKDEYGFKFTGWKRDEQYRGDFIITAQDWNTSDDKLLDVLFGR